MRIELTLYGETPSTKNRYRAAVNKKGKAYLAKDRKLSGKLNYLIQQIPVEYFDLKLRHPRITMQRFCPAALFSQDRDGIFTGLLDLLVRTGVLEDDCDLHNNGEWRILPTQESVGPRVEIMLETEV